MSASFPMEILIPRQMSALSVRTAAKLFWMQNFIPSVPGANARQANIPLANLAPTGYNATIKYLMIALAVKVTVFQRA